MPLARLDADGEKTEQGGLGTKGDAQSPNTAKTIATPAQQTSATAQKHSKLAANDAESQYWASLNDTAQQTAQAQHIKGWGTGTGTEGRSTGTTGQADLCKVYYFHTDQVGMPQELTNAQGQVIWQASYKTWGSTVAEEWEAKSLSGNPVHRLDEGDTPDEENQQQNLRFQGQYLDRETGLHYNTFRYYDPDVGRFICPDPIGLAGGINLGSYASNPINWIDPWGWACSPQQLAQNRTNGKAWEGTVTKAAQGKYGAGNVESQVRIQPYDANGKPMIKMGKNGQPVLDKKGNTQPLIVVADNVVYGANGKPIKILDAKASTSAPLTPNQKDGYPNIRGNGGVILSGPNQGRVIGKTPVDIINPSTVGNI